MGKRKAYVLTRLYNSYVNEELYQKRLTKAIGSIASNAKDYKDGEVRVILYDNSPAGEKREGHIKNVRSLCSENGFIEGKNLWLFTAEEHIGNSAYAAFAVREKALERIESLEGEKTGAVIISLDQDDELKPKAIRRICKAMTDKGIVLTPFSVVSAGGKDITGDGGRIQQKIAKRLSIHPVVNEEAQNAKQSSCNTLKDIVYASSLGWSKSYSYYALKKYHEALTNFLDDSREGVSKYYNKHKNYEDFVDFFALLLADVTITATRKKTHVYNKYSDSITSNPSVDAFRLDRTASLLTLIDLCYSTIDKQETENKQEVKETDKEEVKLRSDFKRLLLRYVSIKVTDIERILEGYRKDFANGDEKKREFDEATHENYFIAKFWRLAEREIRYGEPEQKQDEKLISDAEPFDCVDTKSNFKDLFSCETINAIRPYEAELSNADSRLVLEKAVLKEKGFRPVKSTRKQKRKERVERRRLRKRKEEEISKRYDKRMTPNQIRQIVLWILIGIFGSFLVAFILWALGVIPIWKGYQDTNIILPEIIAILLAILTFLLNEVSKVGILAREEGTKKKLYFSEFEDLIRHLEANLKVMIEVRKQLTDNKVPASVHFNNLAWPESSCLFSDEMSKIIDKGKVDDFARLKVNLRNIQNSARWLSVYVRQDHTREELCEAIDWEIARHFGYLMNFHYMKNNNFQFPTQAELDYYIKERHLKAYLSGLFMSYSGESKHGTSEPDNYSREEMVDKYMKIYYDDRRMRRNVILTQKKS